MTVCTYERRCIFDDPRFKTTAEEVWRTVAGIGGSIDEFVIMPNHVHGIIWIAQSDVVGARQPDGPLAAPPTRPDVVGARQPDGAFLEPRTPSNAFPRRNGAVASPLRPAVGPPSGSLGAIVGSFKSATAKRINGLGATPGGPVWQRNYYEHVVRNDADLTRVRRYILDNPLRWNGDPDNPVNITGGRNR